METLPRLLMPVVAAGGVPPRDGRAPARPAQPLRRGLYGAQPVRGQNSTPTEIPENQACMLGAPSILPSPLKVERYMNRASTYSTR